MPITTPEQWKKLGVGDEDFITKVICKGCGRLIAEVAKPKDLLDGSEKPVKLIMCYDCRNGNRDDF